MSPSVFNTGIAAILAIAGATQAHLVLKTPVPFNTAQLASDNGPLKDLAIGSAGSDFPCKTQPGVYKISQMNNLKVGEPQTLSFTGSASHGGGTCQLAVSLDKEPTTNSTWKIIQVYEGGCPITAAGNAGTDTFSYKIPDKFPNGQATLAWTWFNRIGNREMYMNCAPITVEGGSDNQDFYNTLPNMYVINLPTSQCSSVEGKNQVIPHPGQYIVKGDPSNAHVDATGPACAAAAARQTSGVQGYSGEVVDNGAGKSDGSGAGSGNAAAPQATTAPTYNDGKYTQPAVPQAPVLTSPAVQAPSPTASGLTTVVSSSVLSLSVVAPTSAAAPASPNANGSTASGTSCSPDGAIVCNGETQFGLCNWGSVVWQNVAAGTTCSNGVISKKLVRKDSVHFRAHFGAAHS